MKLQNVAVNNKKAIVEKLQKDILQQEGYKPVSATRKSITGLEVVEKAFPNNVFPVGAVHEFLVFEPEQAAATCGFISGLLQFLMKQGEACIWISTARRVFPAALNFFSVEPHKIVFINVPRDKDVLWATEEALKCRGLAAVVAEVRELTFMQSRRLQLAVESSRVTGFILRSDQRRMCMTACITRWHITPRPSMTEEALPGVGFPRWQADLQKVRNGKPGNWTVEWAMGKFNVIEESKFTIRINKQVKIAG